MTDERETDFVESLGPAFTAHLLRRLSDALVEADKQWHAEHGIANPPRTSTTLLALDRKGPLQVTALAATLRQSHQLVQQWIGELRGRGLVDTAPDPDDRRRSIVSLTAAGRTQATSLRDAIVPMEQATRALLEETAPGLYEALWRLEHRLRAEPFVDRIRASVRAAGGD